MRSARRRTLGRSTRRALRTCEGSRCTRRPREESRAQWSSSNGISGAPSYNPRVESAIAAFLAHLQHARQASAHTLRAYANDLRQFVECSRAHSVGAPKDATPDLVRGYLATLRNRGLSRASIARKLAS